jgi:hypothetical protein
MSDIKVIDGGLILSSKPIKSDDTWKALAQIDLVNRNEHLSCSGIHIEFNDPIERIYGMKFHSWFERAYAKFLLKWRYGITVK